MDKVHRIKNRMDKDEVLNAKSPVMFKEVIRKYPLGSNPSGYSQGKGFITQEKALALYY